MGAILRISLSQKLNDIINKANIVESDVLELRQITYSDGAINEEEFNLILLTIAKIENEQDYWQFFINDTICDFVLKQKMPQDYINEEDCRKIIETLSSNGRIKNIASLRLILKLINQSVDTPFSLKDLVFNEIKSTILTDNGVTRKTNTNNIAHIETAELEIIKNTIYAISGTSASTIGLDEAEYLFEIKDIIIDGENCPEWGDFFAKSIGNHLMAHNFYTKVPIKRAIEHEKFLNASSGGIGSFLSRMFKFEHNTNETVSWDDNHGNDDIERDEKITISENTWLMKKINKDAKIDKYEQAILDFIKQ